MTAWLAVLLLVAIGAGVVAWLTRRATGGIDDTICAFDDARRDLRLAVVELRAERERIVRRVDDLHRR
jgi:hypothetical protein